MTNLESCLRCELRTVACHDCALSRYVEERPRGDVTVAEARAVRVLASAGLLPPLRYCPSGGDARLAA